MNLKHNIRKIIQSDWVIAIFLLLIFLATNGYTYGWDDQHLEIPLLKRLIDPTLYVGDYYVESLKQNFTSFLFPILAKIISVEQVPPTYLLLYLISRYFLFFWIYKLWHHISKDKLTAFCCVLMIIVLGRVEEFLYRTFSHQEFALAIILAGIYFFYKDRFILAALLLGIAANFHALYSLFPFLYMSVYLAIHRMKHKRGMLFKSSFVFAACLIPLVIWVLQKTSHGAAAPDKSLYENWIGLYHLACPQNFIFYDKSLKEAFSNLQTFFDLTKHYWILITLFFLNITHNEKFKEDLKVKCAMLTGFSLLLFSFIFSQIIPTRFVLDLNLIRNTQFMLFFLMGYTTILFINTAQKEKWLIAFLFALLIPLIRFGNYVTTLSAIAMLFLLAFSSCMVGERCRKHRIIIILSLLGLIITVGGIIAVFISRRYSLNALMSLWITLSLLLLSYALHFLFRGPKIQAVFRKLFILIPFCIFTFNFIYYHHRHLRIERTAAGFWQMQRNWIDMQKYVKDHTSKDSLILVPHDMEMGGFRIFSEREIVMSYRDCGIIGFDYLAAVEWQKRLKDIEAFQVFIRKPIEPALKNAIFKYKVNYIVFMNYLEPGGNAVLRPMYRNDVYSLYKVLINPTRSPR